MTHLFDKLKYFFDLIFWYFKTSKIRNSKSNNKSKTLIISEIAASLATVKINCILAKCFESIGYEIIIIFRHKQFLYELYYKLLNINKFYYLDTYPSSNKSKMVKKILETANHSDSFINCEIDGIKVGKWIASRIVREDRIGEFEIDKYIGKKLNDCVNDSVNAIFKIREILKNYKNCSIIFNERGYSPSGEIFDYCIKKNVNTIQWFGSPLEDHHSFKRYNQKNNECHPLTLSHQSFNDLLSHKSAHLFDRDILKYLNEQYSKNKWFNRQNLQENKSIYNKIELIKKLNLDPQKKIAVIFSHVMYDATFFYGTSLFGNYKIWLQETLKAAAKNKNVNWILRVHPVNKFKNNIDGTDNISLEEKLLKETFKILPENFFLVPPDSDISTFSFFKAIDYGLTVRGTVGCELACFGVPVFTAGTGRYSNNGFTIDSKTKKSYIMKLNKIQNYSKLTKKQVKLARIYTYGSLIARSIPMDGINIKYNGKNVLNPYHTNVLFENIEIKELIKKRDIKLLLNWFDDEHLKQSNRDLLYIN